MIGIPSHHTKRDLGDWQVKWSSDLVLSVFLPAGAPMRPEIQSQHENNDSIVSFKDHKRSQGIHQVVHQARARQNNKGGNNKAIRPMG
jgi:hypothetical protein